MKRSDFGSRAARAAIVGALWGSASLGGCSSESASFTAGDGGTSSGSPESGSGSADSGVGAPDGAIDSGRKTSDAATGDAGRGADTGSPPAHFSTLPLGATLPTEAQCTAWVMANPTTETMPENATANHTVPTSAWLAAFRAIPLYGGSPEENAALQAVTGNFTGSTDMIIRWASCKWGIDEDIGRAEAWEESSWRQSLEADSDTVCHSRNVPTTALNYWTEASPCKPSKGLYQEKLVYFNEAPYAATSTPWNADYRMARQRSCMNGDIQYMHGSTSADFGSYPPTNTDDALWGCMGDWYSGQWGTNGSVEYVRQLKAILASRPWPH